MTNGVYITCAVNGSGDSHKVHPAIPVTPAQIAAAALEAEAAGAAIVHIHVRDPVSGEGLGPAATSLEAFREVVERIREKSESLIINLSTGIGGDYVPSEADPNHGAPSSYFLPPLERVRHVLELRPDICSLNMGTMNMGPDPVINLPGHIATMAQAVAGAGVKPELEIFDLGDLRLANKLIADGHIQSPALFQFCLGIDWGAPADAQTMLQLRSMLPDGAVWTAFSIKHHQRPIAAQSILLGGNVRVGLEDNLYLRKGQFASNGDLVRMAVDLAGALDVPVLSAQQTRARLQLK